MQRASGRAFILLSTASCLSFLATAAVAQPASDRAGSQLDEIIVTARKRAESLIDVPVAVSAVSSAELTRKGITDLERISRLVPQVQLAESTSGTGASFTIRGIGTPSLDPGLDQSVVIALDGTPMTRGRVILTGMFDLAQVEVLKGPQSLFFGKNSPAGVVSISSAQPTPQLEGYVRAGYEFEAEEKYLEGAISGPLADTLSGRFAFRASDMEGWVKNVAQSLPAPSPIFFPNSVPGAKNLPGTRELMGRATLLWEPSPNFDATLRATLGHRKDDGTTLQQYCDPAVHAGPVAIGGVVDTSDGCKFDNKNLQAGIPTEYLNPDWENASKDGMPYQDLKSLFTNLTLNYKADNFTVTSISSYWKIDYGQMSNFETTSYGNTNVAIGEVSDSFSQEVRLVTDFEGPLNLTLGGFYETMDRRNDTDSLIALVGATPEGLPGAGRFDNYHSRNTAKAETLSGFGQVRWEITDQLELAGGVRYTKETRKQQIENIFVNPNVIPLLGNFVNPGEQFQAEFRDSNWSPEISLSYKPSDTSLLYAAYKTGYKSGGFPSVQIFKYNPDGRLPVGSDFQFGPERAKGGEVGFKAQLFDRSLRVEAVAYLYDYKDLQQSVFNPATFSFFIFNAANARVKGLELQTEWAATHELRLNASVAYNDAKFRNYPNGACWPGQTAAEGCVASAQDLTGARLPRAPKWDLLAGISYDTAVSDTLNIGLSGDVSYRSSYITQENQAPYAVQKDFALLNAGIRLYAADNSWELALIGRNLTNKYIVDLSTNTTFASTNDQMHAATPRTRQVKLQGMYRF